MRQEQLAKALEQVNQASNQLAAAEKESLVLRAEARFESKGDQKTLKTRRKEEILEDKSLLHFHFAQAQSSRLWILDVLRQS